MSPENILPGVTDNRAHNTVVEGRRLFVEDPRLKRPQPLSLLQIIDLQIYDARLDINQQKEQEMAELRRTALCAEVIEGISNEEKIALVIAHFWEEGRLEKVRMVPVLESAAKKTDFLDINHDAGLTEQRLEFKYLTLPNRIETLLLKRDGKKHRQIANLLKIPLSRVNSISRDLIVLGLSEPIGAANKLKSEKFRMFLFKVLNMLEDEFDEETIARELGKPIGKVKYAISRLSIMGFYHPPIVESMPKSSWLTRREAEIAQKVEELRLLLVNKDKITLQYIRKELGVSSEIALYLLHRVSRVQEVPYVRRSPKTDEIINRVEARYKKSPFRKKGIIGEKYSRPGVSVTFEHEAERRRKISNALKGRPSPLRDRKRSSEEAIKISKGVSAYWKKLKNS